MQSRMALEDENQVHALLSFQEAGGGACVSDSCSVELSTCGLALRFRVPVACTCSNNHQHLRYGGVSNKLAQMQHPGQHTAPFSQQSQPVKAKITKHLIKVCETSILL